MELLVGLLVYLATRSHFGTLTADGSAAAVRTGVICALALGYATAVERVSVFRRYLHLGARGAVWTTQSSVWTFAAVLCVPLEWALVVVVTVEVQHLARGWRTRSGRAYRDVFAIFTTALGCLAAVAIGQLGTDLAGHVIAGSTLVAAVVIAAQLIAYTSASLAAAVIGIRLYGGAPSLRQAIPPRRAIGSELATLVLGVVAAQIIVHNVWFSFAIPAMAAVLWRSTLVTEMAVAAQTDTKTGLLNYSTWRARAEEHLNLAVRTCSPVAVLLVDLDHFKTVNDRYGHLVGDRALVTVADALRGALRSCDVIGRFGGEEFAALLPGTNQASALAAAERVRRNVAAATIRAGLGLTASIGISAFEHAADLDGLLEQADLAMYSAKAAGRNQCQVAGVSK